MKDVNASILAFGPAGFAFNLNLPDERGDGLDRIRHGEVAHWGKPSVREARVNALADGPDFGFTGQRHESLNRIIGDNLIKPAHQSLVGSEYDGADRSGIGGSFAFYDWGFCATFPEACA